MIIDSDYHNHTSRSLCAQKDAAVYTIITELEKAGFVSIGISDHYYSDKPMGIWLSETREEISKVNTSMGVYVGTEVDMIIPGFLEATKEELSAYDYVIAACPHYQNKNIVLPLEYDYSSMAQSSYDYMISAAAIPYIDIIAHPFDARGIKYKMPSFDLLEMMRKFSKHEYLRIIDLLLKNKIAVELTERLRQTDYFEALFPFLALCKESGVSFSFGSDSHAKGHLGSVRKAAANIGRLGIEVNDVWMPE